MATPLANAVTYFGLDISETMVADASEFNAAAVREGRVTLAQGTSTAIPADAMRFDKALALNTIYFWPDLLLADAHAPRNGQIGSTSDRSLSMRLV